LFNTRFGNGGDKYKLSPGFEKNLTDLPVIDLDKKLFGIECSWWRKHIQNKPGQAYWKRADVLDELEQLDIPVFLIGGWFDFGGIGTKLTYERLKKSHNDTIKLIIGPWMHQTIGESISHGYDFGADAELDFKYEALRWFDYHLKGNLNDILDEALVKVFVVDTNYWIEGNNYPPINTSEMKLQFHESQSLNNQTKIKDVFSEYIYDPATPTPSIWYDNIDKHSSLIDEMNDAVIFKFGKFEEPIQVCGPIRAELYASTSGKDTDWIVYYILEDEKEEMQALGRGIIRAKYHTGQENHLIPGKIYHYNLDLWHSSFKIKKGWTIKLIVCSAAFPHYSRNLNTGGDNELDKDYIIARQKIFHSKKYPSSITFTILK
jgi:putative CocE/NonD family hydrolase